MFLAASTASTFTPGFTSRFHVSISEFVVIVIYMCDAVLGLCLQLLTFLNVNFVSFQKEEDISPSNQDVYEIVKSLKQDNNFGVQQFYVSFKNKFPYLNIASKPKSLHTKADRVYSKAVALKRQKKTSQYEEFLKFDFQLPKEESNDQRALASASTEKEKKLAKELHEEKQKSKTLKRQIADLEKVNHEVESNFNKIETQYFGFLNKMHNMNEEMAKLLTENQESKNNLMEQYKSLTLKYEQNRAELDKLQKKLSKCDRNTTGKLTNKCKYRDNVIKQKSTEISKLKEQQTSLQAQLDSALEQLDDKSALLESSESKVNVLRHQKRQLQYKTSYLKRKVQQNSAQNTESVHLEEITQLQEKIKNLNRENRELQQLVSLLQDDEIITFQNGRYCDDIRETIMELLNLNVSMNKVNDVIKLVLKNLAGKEVERLPSNAVKSRLLIEARHLAHVQVAEAMTSGSEGGNCLHGDGTTKYHRHCQSFQITTSSGNTLSFGLQEMAGQDAGALLNTFTTSVDELTQVITAGSELEDKERIFSELVVSIRSTMSDQCSVMPCFNEQLKQLRERLLPQCIENWSSLSKSSQDELKDMCNYFCKLHLLANLATESDQILQMFEGVACEGELQANHVFFTSESGAVRLIRTVCKALHPRGSDEAGVADFFQSFLHEQGKKLQLMSYVGNRLNVQFYNGGAIYFHREDIKSFLESWPNPNNLLKAVQEDLGSEVHLAELRALGIIDKLITGPFWRVVNLASNILELNTSLLQMKQSFESWCDDASPLLDGEPLFPESEVPIHKDAIYNAIFEATGDANFDALTQQALEMLMHGLLLILERQEQDQLPGGKYYNPTSSVKSMSSNVPTTNMASERDFAILDLLIRSKPHATTLAYEALIMWQNNGTLAWLKGKSEEEKVKLMESARKGAVEARARYRDRRDTLQKERLEKLKKKQSDKEETAEKVQQQKVKSLSTLTQLGLSVWTKVEEVDHELTKIEDEKEKREAVLAQINVQKFVLLSKGRRQLFQQTQTVKGQKTTFSLSKLISNLKEIIVLNPGLSDQPQQSSSTSHENLGSKVQQQKKLLKKKVQDLRNKMAIKQQKDILPQLIANPKLLVKRRVKHNVVEEDSDDTFWCEGTVLDVVEDNERQPIKTIYLIHYDIEDDDVLWEFSLLKDMKKGDLILLD